MYANRESSVPVLANSYWMNEIRLPLVYTSAFLSFRACSPTCNPPLMKKAHRRAHQPAISCWCRKPCRYLGCIAEKLTEFQARKPCTPSEPINDGIKCRKTMRLQRNSSPTCAMPRIGAIWTSRLCKSAHLMCSNSVCHLFGEPHRLIQLRQTQWVRA